MPGHIGIVACSAEGAALCYLTVCLEGAQRLGAFDHPEVSMHTHSLARYMKCFERDDWPAVGELMLSSAHKLARAGADFLICPDNTIHQGLPWVNRRSPLPWLHTAERAEINRIIFEELVAGVFRPEAVAYFQRVMGRMKDEGVDAVVLGCTEIPLIMNDAN